MRKRKGEGIRWLLAMLAAGPSDECLLFPGNIARGYGRVGVCGQRVFAHRVAYELAYGPIPEGLFVLHGKERRCIATSCCNPRHLRIGTQAENIGDMVRDGTCGAWLHPDANKRGDESWSRQHPERLARGDRSGSRLHPETLRPVHSEDHVCAKLTNEQVREIRKRREAGESLRDLSAAFGVSGPSISMIARRITWRHVA